MVLMLVAGAHRALSATSPTEPCVTTGPVAQLTFVQAQNARLVVATASARGGPKAALFAVTVALAESQLRSLGNSNDSASRWLDPQGMGHDHDSVGIFQQRASWGSAAARMDPTTSTNLFMDALLQLPGWSTQDPWVVAQEVQRSVYDGTPTTTNGYSSVYGGNYRAQLDEAKRIVLQTTGGSQGLECGDGAGPMPTTQTGPKGAYGLPTSYRVPDGISTPARAAVLYALAQRGKPYLWATAGPYTFDCSGLVHAAWAHAGVYVPHFTGAETTSGTPTTQGHLLPGDLVLVPGSRGNLVTPRHVGMYIGHGLVVNAPKAGDIVRVVTYRDFIAHGLVMLRHIR
jgi:cell wall-associated NlpC family hydrolase